MQLKIQVRTGKEYLFLASNLRTAVWSWKLTVLENTTVNPADKLRTAVWGWKLTVLEYNS